MRKRSAEMVGEFLRSSCLVFWRQRMQTFFETGARRAGFEANGERARAASRFLFGMPTGCKCARPIPPSANTMTVIFRRGSQTIKSSICLPSSPVPPVENHQFNLSFAKRRCPTLPCRASIGQFEMPSSDKPTVANAASICRVVGRQPRYARTAGARQEVRFSHPVSSSNPTRSGR